VSESIATDYRSTLNLPKTDFPMKADLPKREPDRVAWWQEQDVYGRRLARNAGNLPWILHDGPPYANGESHMGHFLNRVLKDIFVKVHLLDGRYARFTPGWDMHGLPIEYETLKHLSLDFRSVDPLKLRAACRERALYWLGVQRDAFKRMGELGDWDHPYMTIAKEYEATIVEALASLVEAEQMYKGLRSTLWCINDETALAEAEIEYHERESPSIYVRFAANDAQKGDLLARFRAAAATGPLSILIWTTTPWTLPANAGIALKPDAAYGLYERGGELLVVAEALAAQVFALVPGPDAVQLASAKGSALVGAAVRHPFLDRDSEVVSAAYVELDTGTGAVHTAPGHGADDFDTGVRFGLPTIVPVDKSGHFTAEAGPYAGLQIFVANPKIVDDLRASGALFHATAFTHQYPHCWRCRNPVIFRATSQWFIALDVNRLRKRIVELLPGINWTPKWGQERMRQMIENHPEWCVSRQRTWGTPIPALYCRSCNATVLDADVARMVAARFRADGADVWWAEPVEAFLPRGFVCPHCSASDFDKERDIVDIWFESGVSNLVVLGKDGMPWPADLYLEGSDQYRGWFRSSLVLSAAIKGAAPYRDLVSAGMVNDEHGHAMHKSTGNYIAAEDAMKQHGADVLRLWVASVEFTADMRLGETTIKNVSGVYRNLRYRLRFLLGLIDDLLPEDLVPAEKLEPIDKLALAELDELCRTVVGQYKTYALHDVYLALVEFDAEDLSRFYLDALKDRAYSSARDAQRRRSAQTAAYRILRALLALSAPVLSFTAEEAWQSVPAALRGDTLSVFDLDMPRPHARTAADEKALSTWATLKRLRAAVAASETVRDFQLQAHVTASARDAAALNALGDNLREALIVSEAHVIIDDDVLEPRVELSPATGEKCARCWKYLPLRSDPLHPTLCAPCAAIVRGFDSAA
jgi:isoleucyl-tRNA synthetase